MTHDDGLGWSTLAGALDADRVRPDVMLLAGNRYTDGRVSPLLTLHRPLDAHEHLRTEPADWRVGR